MKPTQAFLVNVEQLMEKVQMPKSGREFVRKAMRGKPARGVTSRRSNVITYYTSRSTGQRIATESRGPEYRAAVCYDFRRSVKYFTAQPGTVKIPIRVQRTKVSKGNTTVTTHGTTVSCTPDFLALEGDAFYLDEWKTDQELQQLVCKYPYRFSHDENGWHCPERETFFSEMGLVYRLRSDAEHNPRLVENLEYLTDYLEDSATPCSETALRAIQQAMQRTEMGVLSFRELMRVATPATLPEDNEAAALVCADFTVDDVLQAIADRELYVDLDADDLSDLDSVVICRSEDALDIYRLSRPASHITSEFLDYSLAIGTQFIFGEARYTVTALDSEIVLYRDDSYNTASMSIAELERLVDQKQVRILRDLDDGAMDEPTRALSDEDISKALKRFNAVEASRFGRVDADVTVRTLQRWAKQAREAGESTSAKIRALLDKLRPGNRTCRVPESTMAIIKRVADETNNPTNPVDANAYRRFERYCGNENVPTCSSKTFYRHFNPLKDTRAREGSRQDYIEQPVIWHLKLTEKIHGGRPFACVHIDHTKLDVRVRIRGRGGRVFKVRPWLTIAIDAHTRAVLAFYLSIHNPSLTSCMMILRELVRRHKRMPSMIVVDNGKEFGSPVFNAACHRTRTSLRFRPPHESRFGNVCERLFGTTNTLLIHNLVGNTKATKRVRTLTASVDPIRADLLTFPILHGLLDYFFYQEYNEKTHPAHDHTPNEYMAKRLAETGVRLCRRVDYDMQWKIATCLPVPKGGTRMVDRTRGIKIGHLHYWAKEFADKTIELDKVDVRVDMWNAAVVYANVRGHWIRCKSNLLAKVERLTRIDLRYMFETMRLQLGKAFRNVPESTVLQWAEAYTRGQGFPVLASAGDAVLEPYEANGTGATAPHQPDREKPLLVHKPTDIVHTPAEYGYGKFAESDVLEQM